MWGPIKKGKCKSGVCKSHVHSICEAGPMVQLVMGPTRMGWCEQVITQACRCCMGCCSGVMWLGYPQWRESNRRQKWEGLWLYQMSRLMNISLWYWTPPGIESMRSSFINLGAQTFTFVKDDHGATSLTSTISEKESSVVIPDSKLPFDDFLITIPHLIKAMGRAQWLKEKILMMSRFWDNILNHPRCSSGLPNDKQALMVYQEEQHKQWHHTTSVPGHGYNPSEINKAILESTQDHLLWERHQKDDKVYKTLVSIFSFPSLPIKLSSDDISP